jgi:transposase
LLFEALIMALISAMPVAAAAQPVGEHDTRLWRVLHHYVEQARARLDTAAVSPVAIDETAARRGHPYVTLFVDIDKACVLYVTEARMPPPSRRSPRTPPRMAAIRTPSRRIAST